MGKFIDLSGKRFGRLLVISKYGSSKNRKTIWRCLCDCGNEKNILGDSLKTNKTVSCGCYNKELVRKLNMIDISEIRFGRLVAREFVEIRKNQAYWVCDCDCGNEIIINVGKLKSGNTKSCGCYNIDSLKSRKKDLTNMTFGHLFVIKEMGRENSGRIIWLCKCICGNTTVVRGNALMKGSIISCGCSKESYMATVLKKYFKEKYDAIEEYKIFINPKTDYFLPYDIFIPDRNIYIEVHGIQHYEFTEFFHKTEDMFLEMKSRDKLKKKYAKKNGIFVEIDLRKNESFEKIVKRIEKIIN